MHSDLRRRRVALENAWSQWVPAPATRPAEAGLRPEVADSWLRSRPTVDPGRTFAPSGEGGAPDRWARSPLRAPVDRLAGELRSIADDAGFVAAVTDETGTILWTCGGRVMRRRAEQVNFAPGGRWDEPAMGTNALSLALRTGRPSTVFSAEHLVSALHGWVCYCAPIRHPDGRILGTLDLSTTWDRSHPLALSTVRGLVAAIEAGIGPDTGRPAAPAGPPAVRLSCLGRAAATRGGTPLDLPPRRLEILTLLALEPAGFSAEGLRSALYGDRPVAPATVKAEISHLRRALGGAVAARRYRLTEPVDCDALTVLRALERGDTAAALGHYTGPLLPHSDAPGVVERREFLEVAVRAAVLAGPDPDAALRYGGLAPYDTEVHEHAVRLLPPGDGRRAIALGRLHAAQRD
ncbi:GAF domain-containing protein [Kitasatospora sp. NPDC059571]|uniref:GAF domain-containing protein n=1 Tax=Kitasatospora sp. NPDC059571 TaxID=3346871 RepID=UPI0036A32816